MAVEDTRKDYGERRLHVLEFLGECLHAIVITMGGNRVCRFCAISQSLQIVRDLGGRVVITLIARSPPLPLSWDVLSWTGYETRLPWA